MLKRADNPDNPAVESRQSRNATLYLVGLTASMLGNSAMTLAAGIWIKSLTGSNSAAALIGVCTYGPSLFAPVLGLVVDRVRRRRLLLITNLVMAAVLLSLLAVRGAGQSWLIYVAMTCYGAAAILIGSAESALFSALFDSTFRIRLNSLRLTLQESGKLVAPLIGAGLFALAGGGWVAAVDAATFLIAAGSVLALTGPDTVPVRSEQHWRTELAAGLRQLAITPMLRQVAISALLVMAASGLLGAAVYGLVDHLRRSPSFLGVITGALGAGSIIGGLVTAPIMRRAGELRLAMYGALNGTVGYLMTATGLLPLAILGSFVRGFALPWTVIAAISLSQRLSPDNLQGRVSSALTFVLFAPLPFAAAAGAGLSRFADFRTMHIAVAAIGLASALMLFRERGMPTDQATPAATSRSDSDVSK